MNKYLKNKLLPLFALVVLLGACKKEYESIQSVDDRAIQTYLSSNNLNFTKDPSGYYYNITDPGTGTDIANSDSIFYSFQFKTLSGQELPQSSDLAIPGTRLGYTDRFTIANRPFLFTPIRETLARLKRGGKATLIMPSNLAFGKNGLSAANVGSNENILVNLGIYTQTTRQEIDELEINNFLSENKLTAIKDSSRVRYIVSQQGTGDPILAASTLSVNYTGRLLTGPIFESTNGTAASVVLSQTIKGWDILRKFKAGTKIRLFIPSDLGYGESGYNQVPPNQVLDFDIEIVSVK